MGIAFYIKKCQNLQVESRYIKNDSEMWGVEFKSILSVKDLVVTVASNLKFSQQCNESVKKANRMMSLIERNFSFKNKDVVQE